MDPYYLIKFVYKNKKDEVLVVKSEQIEGNIPPKIGGSVKIKNRGPGKKKSAIVLDKGEDAIKLAGSLTADKDQSSSKSSKRALGDQKFPDPKHRKGKSDSPHSSDAETEDEKTTDKDLEEKNRQLQKELEEQKKLIAELLTKQKDPKDSDHKDERKPASDSDEADDGSDEEEQDNEILELVKYRKRNGTVQERINGIWVNSRTEVRKLVKKGTLLIDKDTRKDLKTATGKQMKSISAITRTVMRQCYVKGPAFDNFTAMGTGRRNGKKRLPHTKEIKKFCEEVEEYRQIPESQKEKMSSIVTSINLGIRELASDE